MYDRREAQFDRVVGGLEGGVGEHGGWLLAWEGRTRSNVTAFLAGAGGWSQKGLGGNWDDLPVEKGTRGSAELYHS